MEEQVTPLSELEGLNSELDGLLSDLKGREEGSLSRIHDLETQLETAKFVADSAAARMAAQEAALRGELHETKTSLVNEISKSAALSSERGDLAAKLESVTRLLDEERARGVEKDLFVKNSRSVLKDKEAESEKIWRAMEDLKTEAAHERAALRDREDQLIKFVKVQENLEGRLAQAVRDNARCEEGFILKLDLVKKELREQVRRGEELERSLAEAGSRLDEALQEVAHKESLLAATPSGMLEKFRSWQAALSDREAALRAKEEENAALRGREDSILNELRSAEEKWKQCSAQLDGAVSKLRVAENENEILAGRLKGLEAERDKLHVALKAEVAAASHASQESVARDTEVSGLRALLEEQAARYTELLRKYKDLVLAGESAARDKAVAEGETAALRARLSAAEAEAAEEKTRYSRLLQLKSGAAYVQDFEVLATGLGRQITDAMSIIRGHAEFCAESPGAEGAGESMSVIVRNIAALQKKIDTIMAFSKPVVLRRSPEKLSDIAGKTIEALRSSGRLSRIKARLDASGELGVINVDGAYLAAAVEQLLLNAVEAMPRGGELAIRISSAKGKQRLEIKDTGDGIEKKNLGAYFQPFFTTRPGKMGLGLTLARNVAAAHGGTIELSGEPGRGSVAVLELPEA